MAFVFRSEKKQSIVQPPQPYQPQSVEWKEARCKAVCKGLPHLLAKHSLPIQKENALPIMEANPIHPGSFTFNNSVFRVKQSNSNNFSKHSVERGAFLTQCGGSNLALAPANKIQQRPCNTSSKPSSKAKGNKPIIVSKNLLKTMEHLQKEQISKETLQINETKQNEGHSIDNKNRLRKWQSLKKLSPLKDYSSLDQSKETNFTCCVGKAKQQAAPAPIQKQVKMKFNPTKLQDNEDSDEQDEYDSQATPGPGAYSYQHPNKKEFRSKRKQFQKIFYSQIQRFKDSLKPYTQVTYVNQSSDHQNQRKNSPCQSFLSKSPKFQPAHEAVSPQPGYYDTRQTLEHDLVRQILKSCNSTAFISRSPRSFKVNGQDLPGPGQYTLDRSLQKLMQERNQLSSSYKSHLQRKVNETSKEHSKKKTQMEEESQKINPIHIKQDSILEDLYMSQPVPFMSVAQRFPQPKISKNSSIKQAKHSKACISVEVSPVRQAFNSSQRRQVLMKVGEGVGVGLYELGRRGLMKRSFNVLFN